MTEVLTSTSRESVVLDVIRVQAKAENEGHLIATLRAIELKAKILGYLVDHVQIDGPHYAISDQPMSDQEWRAKYVDSGDKWRENPATAAKVIDAEPDAVQEWKQRFMRESKLIEADTSKKN